jgi:hypothetical protein
MLLDRGALGRAPSRSIAEPSVREEGNFEREKAD